MSTQTGIQWTDKTWNPVVGCTRVSRGCDNCYAVTMTHRLDGMSRAGRQPGKGRTSQYRGLTVLNRSGERHFNGVVRCVEEALPIPLRWKKPLRIFVNSMSDLFHQKVPFDYIDRVFAVMALTPQNTYQILTKRPERMAEYLNASRQAHPSEMDQCTPSTTRDWIDAERDNESAAAHVATQSARIQQMPWPLPNVWLGTSCEDQPTADQRIPHLLRCPAAKRFLSAEPLLGPIDIAKAIPHGYYCDDGNLDGCHDHPFRTPGIASPIHWVIAGGESGGAGARPCNIAWLRSIRDQCRAAGVPCYIKQLGARPFDTSRMPHSALFTKRDLEHPEIAETAYRMLEENCQAAVMTLCDRKGGDMSEWPEDLRVREFPG